ncbi:C-type natriuretic peptide [Apteryx rowi]|uniref:C-type natriuretic peptide n=1 Tax=Apteryx rowi TaxID=308060 RepID=UPI000E1E0B58|nr:C-type natriuretic peptide [Apteryx rowi]
MQISPLLAGGLLLALLSVRLEAKPASQLPQKRAEARPRAGWARLLQDPPARRHKGLHKKGLGKGCFGLKLDRIGAMSGLGC